MSNRSHHVLISFLFVCGFSASHAEMNGDDDEIDLLKEEIERMQQRLLEMQQRLDELTEQEEREAEEREEIDRRIVEIDEPVEDVPDTMVVSGAVRLNYAWRDFDSGDRDRVGDFELELVRVNFRGSIGSVILDAEWRRYNGFQAIHHAWVGYEFSDEWEAELGITRVPFGILPWASHGFWFGGTYYLGYEDDYDAGLKFVHEPTEDWTFHYAFFKNPEYADDARMDRYSFDLVTGDDQFNSEINQFNFRAERHVRLSKDSNVDVGMSIEAGEVYNRATGRTGDRWAIAAHVDSYFGPWNLQLQGMRYEYRPRNPPGVSGDFVQKGGFQFPFLMAARANVVSANVARRFDFNMGPVSGMTCYNNFTHIDPDVDNSSESVQNAVGCMVSASGVYTYIDWITGKNMWFAGGDGIGRNAETAGEWDSRLNINIGYYF